MPLLKLETTLPITDDQRKTLLPALSKIVAETIGKPESYVMVTVNTSAMLMSGEPGDAAFVEVRSIGGLGGNINRALSQKICQVLDDQLGIAPKRVYLNFAEVEAGDWGWQGNTFG